MSERTFEVHYYGDGGKLNHTYTEKWSATDLACPKCAQRTVWKASDGDYYVGEEHICTSCNSSFYLPGEIRDASEDEQDKQRIAALNNHMEKMEQPKPKMFIDSDLPKVEVFPIHPETGEPWQERMDELEAALKAIMADPTNEALKKAHQDLIEATKFEEAAFVACPSPLLGHTAENVYACNPEVWAMVSPEAKAKFDLQPGDEADKRKAKRELDEATAKLEAEAAKQNISDH